MNTPLFALDVMLAATGGCSIDSYVYRDQPLVAKVETGMVTSQHGVAS